MNPAQPETNKIIFLIKKKKEKILTVAREKDALYSMEL